VEKGGNPSYETHQLPFLELPNQALDRFMINAENEFAFYDVLLKEGGER
jgi:hypothetical protein